MDKTIETLIDIAGRWESPDPSFAQQDIQFLLNMIEAKAHQIDLLTADDR